MGLAIKHKETCPNKEALICPCVIQDFLEAYKEIDRLRDELAHAHVLIAALKTEKRGKIKKGISYPPAPRLPHG